MRQSEATRCFPPTPSGIWSANRWRDCAPRTALVLTRMFRCSFAISTLRLSRQGFTIRLCRSPRPPICCALFRSASQEARGFRSGSQICPKPENVHIERYVPQSLLLPYCDLVITHAGFSTVTAALSCGLPMVAIPIDADQPLNAQRCAALGVAEVIQYGQRTPETIRESVRTVLSNPSYRSNAEQIRREMSVLPGPEHAPALLQRLATET